MSAPEPPSPPEPQASQPTRTSSALPPAPPPAAEPDRPSTWQPMLYAKLVAGLAVVAYVVAFIVQNSDDVKIDFVFATTTISLVFLILLLLAVGVLAGVTLSQLHRYRRRRQLGKQAGKPGDARRDVVRTDEAVGKPR